MEENKKRYILATYKIQRSMETLCLYATNEKIKEYLKKIEDTAEYYQKEEEGNEIIIKNAIKKKKKN